jgi:hypothetical protein
LHGFSDTQFVEAIAGGVRKLHNASGIPDVIMEGRAARLVRRAERSVEPSSGPVGYERAGVPNLDDD